MNVEKALRALKAVDVLWTQNALDFKKEMAWDTPVGRVWALVKDAIKENDDADRN